MVQMPLDPGQRSRPGPGSPGAGDAATKQGPCGHTVAQPRGHVWAGQDLLQLDVPQQHQEEGGGHRVQGHLPGEHPGAAVGAARARGRVPAPAPLHGRARLEGRPLGRAPHVPVAAQHVGQRRHARGRAAGALRALRRCGQRRHPQRLRHGPRHRRPRLRVQGQRRRHRGLREGRGQQDLPVRVLHQHAHELAAQLRGRRLPAPAPDAGDPLRLPAGPRPGLPAAAGGRERAARGAGPGQGHLAPRALRRGAAGGQVQDAAPGLRALRAEPVPAGRHLGHAAAGALPALHGRRHAAGRPAHLRPGERLRLPDARLRGLLGPLLRPHAQAGAVLRQPRPADGDAAVAAAAAQRPPAALRGQEGHVRQD